MGWDNNFDEKEICKCGHIKVLCPNGYEATKEEKETYEKVKWH